MDFRPDGVAYLLNLIAEVLYSGKVTFPEMESWETKTKVWNFFKQVLNEKLLTEAKILDDRIRDLRASRLSTWNRESIGVYAGWLKDLYSRKDYDCIAREHIDDAREMPFGSRLEEMRNVAQMNMAICRILEHNSEIQNRLMK